MSRFDECRKDRKTRNHEFRTPRANSYLIVTEGESTEPYYFNGLRSLILEKVGGNVEVINIPLINIKGTGRSTNRLIEEVEKILNKSRVIYQNISLHRDKWIGKLNELFKKLNLNGGVYSKTCPDIFNIVDRNNGANNAIKNAKRRMTGYNSDTDKPSEFDPGTTVYKLVEELKSYIE